LQEAGFIFKTFVQYLEDTSTPFSIAPLKLVILRHDVDLLPQSSLRFAKIQAEMGVRGFYYFRAVSESWDEYIIKQIADLGHEVGDHYETMDSASAKLKVKSEKMGSIIRLMID
jgi:hypothetical protein